MIKKKKICIVANELPFPPNNGGKSITYFKILALNKSCEIYLIAFLKNLEKLDLELIKQEYKIKDILLIDRPIVPITKLSFKTVVSIIIKFFTSNIPFFQIKWIKLQKSISDYIINNSIDIVLTEGTLLCTFLDFNLLKKTKLKIINTVFDLENKLFFEQVFNQNNLIKYLFMSIEKQRIKSYEKEILKKVDSSLCLSIDDYKTIVNNWRIKNIQILQPFILSPNYQYNPFSVDRYIIFSGSLNFYPNYQGLKWFLQNVFSEIIKIFPTLKLMVISNIKLSDDSKFHNNIIYKNPSNQDEVTKLQASSILSIIPIFHGSGIKIKAIETLSTGTPTIITFFVSLAFPDKRNLPFIICNNKDEFIERIIHLLTDGDYRKALSKLNLEYFDKYFCYEKNYNKLIKIINDK